MGVRTDCGRRAGGENRARKKKIEETHKVSLVQVKASLSTNSPSPQIHDRIHARARARAHNPRLVGQKTRDREQGIRDCLPTEKKTDCEQQEY